MNLLSADHRAKVQSVVDSFNAGNLSMCQAAEKIAGVLSPAESAQVLAQEQKMRESLGPPPPPMPPPGMPPQQMQPGPGAPPPHEMPPPHVEMHFVRMTGKHRPDAGEVVLMLSAIP
ncbi:MAG TPA: hypothetical protein VGZ02_06845 [Candidatus Baltobacteraceae bacterium]|nr:hypothetical protein [Candidatus Baltobacteraceae bacterium]